MPTTGWVGAIQDWRIPGHEFVHGLLYLRAHTIAGHRAVLFDQFSQRGFVLYYPVVLAIKTPVPFLVLAGMGLVGLTRVRTHVAVRWFAGLVLGALGVLLVALTSPINLGVRHVLVIYPLVAIAAAFGLVRWAEQSRRRRPLLMVAVACVALELGLLVSVVPNQIAFFNVFAGSQPSRIISDSDFDWGQDMLALEQYVGEHRLPELYVSLNGPAKACGHHLTPLKALPTHAVSGWVAVSERNYRLNRGLTRLDPCGPLTSPANQLIAPPGWLDWLKQYEPVAIIGKTIRLYNIPTER
jgi:hypothetical protein